VTNVMLGEDMDRVKDSFHVNRARQHRRLHERRAWKTEMALTKIEYVVFDGTAY
jgi:hypothetical protein